MTLQDSINSVAETIQTHLNNCPESLRERVDDWCELHGLERLDTPELVVARQAAFNILLKAALHEHYHKQGILPELNGDVRDAFNAAEDMTNDPAFGEFVLDDVAYLTNDDELDTVIEARDQLESAEDPAEEIGRLFEALVPQESRRKLGQFRTPPEIAELMADWLITDGSDSVLDPGMGAGALSAAAYRQKQQKHSDAPLSDIYGADLNDLALVMAATSLTLLNHGGPHNLQVGDFLEMSAEDDIDEPVDAVISNPPYTRHHELSEEYKQHVNERAESDLGGSVSALSPMYAYFYYHASEFLAPGGRVSFITPSEFLETSYGESLKQYLAEEFDIKALVLFDRDESSKFDEAMTTSLVSFLENPTNSESSEITRFVRVDGDPDTDTLVDAIEGDVEGETDWGFVNAVRQDDLEPDDKWTGLFDPVDIDTSELTPLSELATVNRGIATGMNDFFCLTQSEVDEWDIDKQYLSKIIRNSRSVPGYDYTDEDWEAEREEDGEVWVLYHLTNLDPDVVSQALPDESGGNATLATYSDENEDIASDVSGVIEYLQHGMKEVEAHTGYLTRNRSPWFVVDRRDPPPILVTYMSRGGSRFIKNETDARNLSNLHGIYLDVEISETELKALLAYLNSEFASEVVRRSGRTYSSGMDKIEPNEMEGVPVLDPRGLDDETAEALADLFDELREAARDNREKSVDEAIAAIDKRLESTLDT